MGAGALLEGDGVLEVGVIPAKYWVSESKSFNPLGAGVTTLPEGAVVSPEGVAVSPEGVAVSPEGDGVAPEGDGAPAGVKPARYASSASISSCVG